MATTWPPSSHPSDGHRGPQTIPSSPQEKDGELRRYLRIILPRKWFLVTFLLLVLGGMAVYTYSQTPIFKANALVLIQPKEVSFMGAGVQGVQDPVRDALATQYQLLASRRVAEPVFLELKFDKKTTLGAFTQRITIEPQRGSQMVRVGFLSESPEEAAKVADALVESYMSDNRQRAVGITDQGLKQLRAKADELRKEVEQAATDIAKFRRDHPDLPLDGTPTVASTRLVGLNTALIQAEAERIAVQAELESLKATPEVSGSLVYYQLSLDARRLTEERDRLLQRFKPDHPVVIEQAARLRAAQDQAQAAHQALLADTNRRLVSAVGKETRLRAEVQKLSQALDQSARDVVQYRFMVEGSNQTTTTYRALLKRIDEIDLSQATMGEGTNVYLVERADVPRRPIMPDTRRNMLVALVVGLIGGIALCFLIDYLDRSIKTKDEAESVLGVPVLGHMPAVQGVADQAVELVAILSARSTIAEAFRTIRTSVAYGLGAPRPGEARRVLVTSTLPRDGKTLCSVNLAIALAQQGKRTLLIDCDLRKPRIASVFGLDSERVGLSAFLAGEEQLSELQTALYSAPGLSLLSVLTSGTIPPNPADLLNSDRMDEVLRACDRMFDWVVIDAPPAVLADPAILISHVPNVVFVVRSFVTARDAAVQAVGQLRAVNARMVGVVMNNANLPRAATSLGNYGYGYGYGYGGYGYGYGQTATDRPRSQSASSSAVIPGKGSNGSNGSNGSHAVEAQEETRDLPQG